MPLAETNWSTRTSRRLTWRTIRKSLVYSRGTRRSTGKCFHYTLRFLTPDDLDRLCDLQTEVVAKLPRPLPIYERDRLFFRDCVTERGCVVGAVDAGDLIGYATLFVPGPADINYGVDLGFAADQLARVAHLAGSAIHHAYRGNRLQSRLVAMREMFARRAGFHHLCGEVVPYNAISMANHFAHGYVLKGFRIDQFGLPNFILHKDLHHTPQRLVTAPIHEVPLDDISTYRRMIAKGYWGFRITRTLRTTQLAFSTFA